jgi:hypothetical protein
MACRTPNCCGGHPRRFCAFFAARTTLRGSLLETAIRFGNWSGPQQGGTDPDQERELPPRVRSFMDQALALPDESDSGTPAIFGRYVDWLQVLDRAWVDSNKDALLDAASARRKELVWEGHLLHSRSTLLSWEYFAPFAEEEIERIDHPGHNNDWRGKQLTQLLLYLLGRDRAGAGRFAGAVLVVCRCQPSRTWRDA